VLSAALHAGFRESGAINIASNLDGETTPMVAVRSTGLAFDSVVGYLHDSNDYTSTPLIFSSVGESYLRSLVAIANMRFQENTRRIERFVEALDTTCQPGILLKPKDREWEDADTRRERKRAEGLGKKQALQERRRPDQPINGPGLEDEVPVHQYRPPIS
jgi:tRNA wybutosine-synthesizing protein 3